MKEKIQIIHFSDTHITNGSKFRKDCFQTFIEQIKDVKRDFVIHTGDVTDEGLINQYAMARELLKQIKPPFIALPGNHDVRNVGYELFEKFLNPREGFYYNDDFLLIWIDSSIPDKNEGRFGETTIRKIRKLLVDYGDDRVKILAFHHHVLPIPKTGRERHITIDAGAMIETILDFGVDLVLSGHRHFPNNYKLEDTIIVNAGTVSSYKTRAGGPRTYNVIKIRKKKDITVKTIILDTVNHEKWGKQKETFSIAKTTRLVQASPVKFRIVQISNTHISEKNATYNAQAMAKALILINRLRPDCIVHNGSITSQGRLEEYKMAKHIFEDYEHKLVAVAGPRDLLGLGYEHYTNFYDQKKIVDFGKVAFYRLESSQPEEWEGHIGRKPLRKFEEDTRKLFRKHNEKIQVAVLHHHLIPIPKVRENYVVEDAGDTLRAIVNSPVKLVLTGFKHISFTTRLNNTIFVNVNSLSSSIIRSRVGNSFNVIDILENEGIIVREINVNSGSKKILGIYPKLGNKKLGRYVEEKIYNFKKTELKLLED